jgi:PAS domain S-box-containing protein
MMASVKKLLAPPVFDGDNEKTRKAALLNTILVAGFALLHVYLIALPLLFSQENPLWALLRYPMIIGSWILLRRGKVGAACLFFIICMWIIQLFVWGGSGGLQPYSIAGVIIRVMITGLLLGGRWAFLFAALSLVQNAIISYAIARGYLLPPSNSYTPIAILTEQGIWSFLAALLLSLWMSSLNRALRQAGDELSERKRVEGQLRVTEERFSKAFKASPSPMGITTLGEGRFIEVNESFLQTTGYSREELIGQTVASIRFWGDPADRAKLLDMLNRQEDVRNVEMLYRMKDGEERFMLVSADIIELDGEPCLLAVGSDITNRKQAEEALRATEERFSKAFNASPNPMAINSLATGCYIDINDAFLREGAFTREEVIGRTPQEMNLWVDPEERKSVAKAFRESAKVRNMEARFRRKDGALRVGLFSIEIIMLNGEECTLSVFNDITERKQAEEALRLSEERYRLIVENQTEFIVKWLPDGTRTFVNESYCRYFGLSEEECIGTNFIPLVTPEFRDMLERKIASLTPENPQSTSEHISFAAGGEQRWQQWTDKGIFDAQGKLVELQSSGRDITERKQAEMTLRATEERFSKAFNASPMPMAIHSLPDIRYLDVNDAFVRNSEFTRDQVLGRTWGELRTWVDPKEEHQVLKALQDLGGRVRNMESRFRCKGGDVRVGMFSSEVITLDGEECLLSVVNDITERKQAEEKEAQLQEAIHKSALEWRRTFDSVESVLMILNPEGRIIRLNRAAKALSGSSFENLIGQLVEVLGRLQPWQEAAKLVSRIRENRRAISSQIQDETSGTAWDISASMISGTDVDERIIIIARDITGMVKLQASLRRSETMSAMGAVVAGVAHEVRNPLFSISATLDAFEARFGERQEYQQHLKILRGEVKRLNDLMSDLLEYGKPFNLELVEGSIPEIALRAIRLCEALVSRSQVKVINRIGHDLAPVMMDRRRVVQVFQNVLQNAIQHSAPGAEVIFEAEQIFLDDGLWIHCRISDSGPGFRDEELLKVFEPFFTRRRGGTGIGLSIVQRIMEEHGGRVIASNRPEGGAVVELQFQAVAS